MKRSIFIQILTELSQELNFKLESFSQDWILRLSSSEKRIDIISNNWSINSATSQLIAKDKVACHLLLKSLEIPSIDHFLFTNPKNSDYVNKDGNWIHILELYDRYPGKIVVKPNNGSSGKDIFLVKSIPDLEETVHLLFQTHRNICLSPFCEIIDEFRVILLNGSPCLIFKKDRPFIIGDGNSTVEKLIYEKYQSVEQENREILTTERLSEVLPQNEKLVVSWKHNLAKGATASIVNDTETASELSQIAIKAADAIGINFASIDIVEHAGGYSVIEINAGISVMEFASESSENYQIAKSIYKKAILSKFDL